MTDFIILIPTYTMVFLLGIGIGFVAPILPLYADALGATHFTIGLMGTAFTVAFVLLVIPAGWLSDRVGRRKPLAMGLLGHAVVSYAMSLAGNVLTLIFLRSLQGAASALIWPAAYATIGDRVEPRNLGKAMGLFGMLHAGGMAGGSVIGGFLASRFEYSFVFVVCSIMVFTAAAVAAFAMYDIRKVFAKKSLSFPDFRVIVKNKSLFSCYYTGGIVAGFIEMSMAMLTPAYLDIMGFNKPSIGLMYTSLVVSVTLAQLLAGWLSDRFGRIHILSTMLLVASASCILFTLSTSFFEFSLTLFLIGFSYSSAYPAALAFISEMQKDELGSAMGVYSLMHGVGGMVGPAVGGAFADRVILQAPYFFNGIMAFSGVILTFLVLLTRSSMWRKTFQKSLS